jgi:hypothetical protein
MDVPAAAGGERRGKAAPFLLRHSASGTMPESLLQIRPRGFCLAAFFLVI